MIKIFNIKVGKFPITDRIFYGLIEKGWQAKCKTKGFAGRKHTKKSKNLMKKNLIGMLNKKHTEETIEKMRKVKLGKKCSEEIKKKISQTMIQRGTTRGENNPAFNGWASREPYGKEFSPKLKERIRKKYDYQCQECLISQNELDIKLDIHHIDFNKQNNSEDNLISLCRSCHIKLQVNSGGD